MNDNNRRKIFRTTENALFVIFLIFVILNFTVFIANSAESYFLETEGKEISYAKLIEIGLLIFNWVMNITIIPLLYFLRRYHYT